MPKPLVDVKVLLMIKTKTIAKGKCFGSPTRQRDFLVWAGIGLVSKLKKNKNKAIEENPRDKAVFQS